MLDVPQGSFLLHRLPRRKRELLQAWDAADAYILRHVAESYWLQDAQRLLILNDSFGALAVALSERHPTAQSDSWLSQQATRINLTENALPDASVSLLSSLEPLTGTYERVIIKVPKTLALLEHQLITLRAHMDDNTQVIAAGMVKAMPESAWRLMERIIGPTRPSRAVKKARLIFVDVDGALPVPENPYPHRYTLEGTDFQIINHANVFSRQSLDIGTRLFLQHLPSDAGVCDMIDLGCGNGVVGLMAAQANPGARLHFLDESHMAVASAQANFENAFGPQRSAVYRVGDILADYADDSADYVLCNPPFHQQSTVGTQIALRMFNQARRVLRPLGELRVIGNRHLRYDRELKRLFPIVETLGSDRKFVVLSARISG